MIRCKFGQQTIALLLGLALLSSTGCMGNRTGSRLASLNPFNRNKATEPATSETMLAKDDKGGFFSRPFWKKDKAEEVATPDPESTVDPLRLDRKVDVNAEVFVANGRLWESTGNTEKAMENYSKALEKEPNNPEALANIARIHYRDENYTKAAEFFSKATSQQPENAGLYNDLGLTMSKMGQHAQASTMLSKALELAPGTSRYANNLASVRYELGDHSGAFKVLEQNNKPAVAHFNMAFLSKKHGNLADTKKHLAQAMTFESESAKDSAVKQAVDRSRQMLAQIDGAQNPMSHIADGRNAMEATVRQTSQAAAANAKSAVAPAIGNIAPAVGNAAPQVSKMPGDIGTFSKNFEVPNLSGTPDAQSSQSQAASSPMQKPAADAPSLSLPQAATPPAVQLPPAMPTKDVPPAAAEPQKESASKPSMPFALPSNFSFQPDSSK